MLLKKINYTITKYGMLKPGDSVLVAVSGGPDSVCLLSVLRAFTKELDLTLHIAHLDHMFRGKESADEALFVAGLAEEFGIPATVEKFDVPAFCRERGLSSQAGAREVRYVFLQRVAGEAGASRLALGHTATDQAETLLMRLIRGAGVSGLSAIPPVRENIIRPLIEVTRPEVMEYLEQKHLDFVTDSSNVKPAYMRNRVRLEIMPVLEKFNPELVRALSSAAALLRDEDQAMEMHLLDILPGVIIQEDGRVYLKLSEFNSLHIAFKRRILRRAAELSGYEPSGISSVQIEDALLFMSEARTGRAMQVLPGLVIERQYDRFLVHAGKETTGFCIRLSIPGVTTVSEAGLEVEAKVLGEAMDEPPPIAPLLKEGASENYLWQAAFDYDKIRPPLYVRSRRPGDRFHPAGMGGKSKKLQDYFVDEKVPRLTRDNTPIVASEQDVVWVVGMRTDGRFLTEDGTKRVLAVGVRRINGPGIR